MSQSDSYRTPTIDRATPLPDIGDKRFSGERFFSREFQDREWTHLWRRTWNMGPRVEEFRQPGDYVIHNLGKESFIFVMSQESEIRAFYNVCQHRGRRIICDERSGNARFFKCAFHAWSWNIDGSIKGVPDQETYPQFCDGLPKDELALSGIRVDTWEGPAREVRLQKQKINREQQAGGTVPHLPYPQMTDEQLSDVFHYFYFPGAAQNIFPEGINTFRYRPHESDPGKCYYDLVMMAHFPEGQEPEGVEHVYFDHKIQYVDLLDPAVEVASFILQQDADNMPEVQQGVQSEGYKGMFLGEQEIRVRHFHNMVDRYLQDSGGRD